MSLDIDVRKKLGRFDLNFAFKSEESGVTALFGHSGAGKTSVINMIAGLINPDEGKIVVNGKTMFDSEKKINLPPEKRRFGYVFQDGRLFPHMSVRSNIYYGMKRIPKNERHVGFDEVVDLLGISHLLNRHPARLSGGEKQRVAIGRALLTSPLMLLMDEPLASLDAARKDEVLPFISRLSSGLSIPILYVSHSVDEILNLADTLVFMSGGNLIASGSVEEVTLRKDFQKLAGRMESGVVLTTHAESHDIEAGLTKLRFGGCLMNIPLADIPIGTKVRVRIHPRNVGIALKDLPGQTSFQNIFKGRVVEINNFENSGLIDVRIDIGSSIISTITPAAQKELKLKPGMDIYAMIKSVSISLGNSIQNNK